MDSVSKKELRERCETNDIKPLEDLYDVEDVAFIIKDLTHKIDIQKAYKKKRTEAINDEIKKLESRIDYCKRVIVATLEKHDEKTLNLPDACKINLRKSKPKWVINNEESLIDTLVETQEINNCAQRIEKWKLVKKDVDKVLNDWEKSESLPDSVHKKIGETGVSIAFAEKKEEDIEEDVTTVPIKEEDYDELEW